MSTQENTQGAVENSLPHREPGVFTHGSTLRHVLVMAATSSIGLMAIFIVDFLNLLYISWLGHETLTAAIGYASTVNFILISVCIGIMIAISALVSRALGARERKAAERLSTSGLIYVLAVTMTLTLLLLPFTGRLLTLLGATGQAHDLAARFLLMTLPTTPLIGCGMAFMGILRAVGDARRGMWVTLGGGLVTAALDPLFIFVFGLGLDGAAIVMLIARITLIVIGAYGVLIVHKLAARISLEGFRHDFRPLSAIALPAVLTNIATPVANGYVTSAIAAHGDAAVAAWTVISRLIPLAFGATFALSGAVGPILGQNLGALLFHRLRRVMQESLMLILVYTLVVWALIYLAQNAIIYIFAASGEAAELIHFYCTYVVGTFIFMGALFVANAAFNNLGFPLMSTFFNWARATLGTIPFVIFLGAHYGAKGILLGQGLGAAVFGIAAVYASFFVIGRMEKRAAANA